MGGQEVGVKGRPSQEGFSLIELLIVVAIILIIAAIAIPNLIRLIFRRRAGVEGCCDDGGNFLKPKEDAMAAEVNGD